MYERREKKDTKKMHHIFGLVFAVILIALFVTNLVVRDKESSDMENRPLAQRPDITWQGIASGSYMERYESYLADQFAGRNAWRRLYTVFRRVGGSREENGVLLGKKRQLMENIVVPDAELLDADLEGLDRFADSWEDANVSLLLVPDAAETLKKAVPKKTVVADQEQLFGRVRQSLSDQITWIDGIAAFADHTGEKLYYKTDHHWTSRGAYDMFLETAGQLGISHPEVRAYNVYPVTKTFNGTLSSMSGFCLKETEQIDVYLPENPVDYLVTYVDEQKKTTTLYDREALNTKDKYAVFLGGNYSQVVIDTMVDTDRTLLLVKDSFANSYVPFLIPYFNRIVMVDPRYYSGTADELMRTYGATDVLILYSGNTFFQDTNIQGFFEGEQ